MAIDHSLINSHYILESNWVEVDFQLLLSGFFVQK